MRLFGEELREFSIGENGSGRLLVASGVEMGNKKMNNEQLIMNNWLNKQMVKKN